MHVSFATGRFTEHDVRQSATAVLDQFGPGASMIVAYFDHGGDASGYAYPGGGQGLFVPPAKLLKELGGKWPFDAFAQMIARGRTATVWYRNGAHTATWNLQGTRDTSSLGTQLWLRSVRVVNFRLGDAIVNAYVESTAPQGEKLCHSIAEQLRSEWAVPELLLIMRHDHWFGGGGPVLNAFAPDWLNPPTMDELRHTAQWNCLVPGGTKNH